MQNLFIFLFFSIGITIATAQRQPGMAMADLPKEGIVTGKVQDSLTGQHIEYATISLFRKKDTSLITGTITDSLGLFRLEGLPCGNFFIETSFIGFAHQRTPAFMLTPKQKIKDIGVIRLVSAATLTGEVEITAQRPRIEFKLDKKVINVSQDISSAGGTAVNVLENTPSVETDIEGNVTLRGSTNFKVLVDGKPTMLKGAEALRQIPANTIETIEIITNPSAKYDPDGLAGIINVVLKKNKTSGISGMISGSASSDMGYNSSVLVNYRTTKSNFFTGASMNSINHYVFRDITREIYSADTTYLHSLGKGNMEQDNYNFKAGMDWFLTPKTSLSLSGEAGESNGGRISALNFYEHASMGDEKYYIREGTRRDQGPEFSSTLSIDHTFSGEQNKIEAMVFYSARPETENAVNTEYIADAYWNKIAFSDYQQRSFSNSDNYNWRIKTDYIRIFSEDSKFEAGAQSDFERDNGNYRFEKNDLITGNWVNDPLQTNMLDFRRDIHAVYSVYSNKLAGLGFQAGLRGELTDMLINQRTSEQTFRTYTFDYFPTLHISRQLPAEQQLMASYSRRINRPGGHELNPFRSYMDRQTFRVGNPALESEYINSYELGYQKRLGISFVSLEGYYRQTLNKLERISRLLNDSTTYYTYDNISSDYSTGIELTANIIFSHWWNVFATGTMYNYRIKGTLDTDGDVNQTTNTWNMRFANNFRLKWNTRIQLTGFYSAPTITAQGERGEFLMTGIGVRHDFRKGKFSATFNVNDIFQSMKIDIASRTTNLYSHFILTHEAPIFSLSLTYRINNYKEQKGENGTTRPEMNGGEF